MLDLECQVVFSDELVVGLCSHDKPIGDWKFGSCHFAKICPFTAHQAYVIFIYIFKPEDKFRMSHTFIMNLFLYPVKPLLRYYLPWCTFTSTLLGKLTCGIPVV